MGQKSFGHRDMHLFSYFNNSNGWLIMWYKMSLTNALWSPKNGPPIPLWQVDDLGHPKLPKRLPNLVSFDFIYRGMMPPSWLKKKKLSTYMEFWGIGMCKDKSYVQKLGPHLNYWENILELLSKPLPSQNSTLSEGFWPPSNWKSNHMWGAIPPLLMLILKT